ncbi:hypothetical protein GGH12_002605 [Coemansia sp. RSA 1822]|nr:hypothetical protein GGH12_002605 [Coemansia sp. RSA 1822]
MSDHVNGPILADALHYVDRDGLGELQRQSKQQSPPNKKRGAALPLREILKAAEPVRRLDAPAESVRHMDVLAEPIMQGRKQPCTEKRSSSYCADRSEQHVSEISATCQHCNTMCIMRNGRQDTGQSTNAPKHKLRVASATCPVCSGLQQQTAQDSGLSKVGSPTGKNV